MSSNSNDRGGALLDALLFLTLVGTAASFLWTTTVIPASQKARRTEQTVQAAEVGVDQLADDVRRLRAEIAALRSDPWFIEKTMKKRAKELRPDLFPAVPLPASVSGTAAPGGRDARAGGR